LRQENEERFSDLDNQFSDVDTQFEELYKALTQMLAQKEKEEARRPIGYVQDSSNEDK
jgi:chaperonin cofactor prefoldin